MTDQIRALIEEMRRVAKTCEDRAIASCVFPWADRLESLSTSTEEPGEWSCQPPTESGWYWFSDSGRDNIELVYVENESCVYFHGSDLSRMPAYMPGNWWSIPINAPIPTPPVTNGEQL